MDKDLEIIQKSMLFENMKPQEIEAMLNCLAPSKRVYEKGTFIWHSGQTVSSVGLVLNGSVHIIEEDFWGNRTILAEASQGQLFGDAYACTPASPLEISVVAAGQTEILFLDVKKITTVCTSSCAFHSRLIRNLLSVLAQKNLLLTQKIKHMGRRSTREKLLSYLSEESMKQKSAFIQIPFNRQQLADFLCVDRSAMSSELGKLQKEGILEFHKNCFKLKGEP